MGAGFSSDEEEHYSRTRRARSRQPQIPPVRTRAPAAAPTYYQPHTTSIPNGQIGPVPVVATTSPQPTPLVYFHAPPGTRVLYTIPAVSAPPGAPVPPLATTMPGAAGTATVTNTALQSNPNPSPTSTTTTVHTRPAESPYPAPQQMMMYYVKTPGYRAPLAIPVPVGQPGPVHVRIDPPRRDNSLLDPFFWGFDSDSDDDYYPAAWSRKPPSNITQTSRATNPTVEPIRIHHPEKEPSVSQVTQPNVIENYVSPDALSSPSEAATTPIPAASVASMPPSTPVADTAVTQEQEYSIKERDETEDRPSKTLKLKRAKPPSEFALHEEL